MAGISVVLTTLNEEHNIDRCLGSVTWADEIVVVDSFSGDDTVAKARAYTDLVFEHEYLGSSRQVEWAIGQASGDWIFVIDADEVATPELAAEMQAIARDYRGEPDQPVGYRINRRVEAFGAWIWHGGWFPDYQFRFFRRDSFVAHHQEVHGGFDTEGPVGRLNGLLDHHTYDTVFAYVARMNDYSSLDVANRLRRDPDARAGWTKLIFNPLAAFLRMYVSKRGWQDGFHGFALALLTAMNSQLTYLKLWEYRMREDQGEGALPPVNNPEVRAAKART